MRKGCYSSTVRVAMHLGSIGCTEDTQDTKKIGWVGLQHENNHMEDIGRCILAAVSERSVPTLPIPIPSKET